MSSSSGLLDAFIEEWKVKFEQENNARVATLQRENARLEREKAEAIEARDRLRAENDVLRADLARARSFMHEFIDDNVFGGLSRQSSSAALPWSSATPSVTSTPTGGAARTAPFSRRSVASRTAAAPSRDGSVIANEGSASESARSSSDGAEPARGGRRLRRSTIAVKKQAPSPSPPPTSSKTPMRVNKPTTGVRKSIRGARSSPSPVLKMPLIVLPKTDLGDTPANADGSGGEEQYDCRFCERSFSKPHAIGRHEHAMHAEAVAAVGTPNKRPHWCTTCGRRYSMKQTLRVHQKATGHGGADTAWKKAAAGSVPKELRCKQCSTVFRRSNRRRDLERHIKVNHTTHACERCGDGFTLRQLSIHKRFGACVPRAEGATPDLTNRRKRLPMLLSPSTVNTALKAVDARRRLMCTHCEQWFLPHHLGRHVAACAAREKKSTTASPAHHRCQTCNCNVASTQKLRVHESVDHAYACPMCTLRFTTSVLAEKHIRSTHSAAREEHAPSPSLVCRFCSKRFYREMVHAAHERQKHAFGCKLCERKFIDQRALAAHGRSHRQRREARPALYQPTSERTERCADCGRQFAGAKGLAKHRSVAHKQAENGAGETKQPVERCDRCLPQVVTFATPSEFALHQRIAHGDVQPGRWTCGLCGVDVALARRARHEGLAHTEVCKICSARLTRGPKIAHVHWRKFHDPAAAGSVSADVERDDDEEGSGGVLEQEADETSGSGMSGEVSPCAKRAKLEPESFVEESLPPRGVLEMRAARVAANQGGGEHGNDHSYAACTSGGASALMMNGYGVCNNLLPDEDELDGVD